MPLDLNRGRSRPSIATDWSGVAAIAEMRRFGQRALTQPTQVMRRDTALPSPHSGQRVSRRHIDAVPLRAAQLNRATIHNAAHALYVHGTDDRLNLCRVP